MRAVLAVIALLVLAPPARAATVSVRAITLESCGRCAPDTLYEADYTAAPGERNDVQVTGPAGALHFSDDVPIMVGTGCMADATGVLCVADDATVDGGDGDDVLRAIDVDTDVDLEGGPGNDAVAGRDYTSGGPGDDALTGSGDFYPGPGNDVVIGGPGRDTIHDPDGPSADRFDGGGGDDTVSYDGRTGPIHVDSSIRATPARPVSTTRW